GGQHRRRELGAGLAQGLGQGQHLAGLDHVQGGTVAVLEDVRHLVGQQGGRDQLLVLAGVPLDGDLRRLVRGGV
ncbi:MAG: hypothetical protein AVDCRST_MAG61-44, partial [uncultured Friedmanniella sp.]